MSEGNPAVGRSRRAAFARWLFQPVDVASLAAFRVAFGLIMLWEAERFLASDWIAAYYIEPEFHFTYYGFGWVRPWPGAGMYWHFALLGLLAAMIAAGALYRVAMPLFAVGFAYVFLLDQARYLNHFYLIILLATLMSVLPLNRAAAVDAWARPRSRAATLPAWTLFALRAQMEVVYVYAGLVKLNPDWLRLEPMRTWLHRTDLPLAGPWLAEEWVVALATYGAIAVHLVGGPLLLFRRTRAWAFVAYVAFHLGSAMLFGIGVFPWLSIAATTLFFDPAWPRKLAARLAGRPLESQAGHAATAPARRPVVVAGLGAWFLVQLLVPLRHVLYPGNVSWTEEGHRFAWQMLLRQKDCEGYFDVRDPATGRTWRLVPGSYLTRRQKAKMLARPDMVLQFAHHLAARWARERQVADAEVRGVVSCSLNGRPPSLLVDPERDLARVRRSLAPADWIVPLGARPVSRPAPPAENGDDRGE